MKLCVPSNNLYGIIFSFISTQSPPKSFISISSSKVEMNQTNHEMSILLPKPSNMATSLYSPAFARSITLQRIKLLFKPFLSNLETACFAMATSAFLGKRCPKKSLNQTGNHWPVSSPPWAHKFGSQKSRTGRTTRHNGDHALIYLLCESLQPQALSSWIEHQDETEVILWIP